MRTAADFGYRVREERERQGTTQAALAERADVSIRWLSNFERGKSPRAELIKVVHVARALGLVFELAEESSPALSETQQRLLTSIRAGLPATTLSPAPAQTAVTAADQTNQRRAKPALNDVSDSTRRMAEAMPSSGLVSPGAMQVVQSMLEKIGRSAAGAQPTTGPEGGDGNAEA